MSDEYRVWVSGAVTDHVVIAADNQTQAEEFAEADGYIVIGADRPPTRSTVKAYAHYSDGGGMFEVHHDPVRGDWFIDDVNHEYEGPLTTEQCATALGDFILWCLDTWMYFAAESPTAGWAKFTAWVAKEVRDYETLQKLGSAGLLNLFGSIKKEYDRAQTNPGPTPGPG